ncbi:MAG: ABC transporter substrate-binding protein [Deltaproteobacteria bacterium]|nr:ABC transporter substrate-binding protein [Deltaproteobacteria bacterium]MBW1815591.1 ABC transporter substrate-binding protein [Deltaproteobacteria bacterium]MBW2283468.1 ABC transporter substrate-binding protein [Deltaproteobacteria bacterium]
MKKKTGLVIVLAAFIFAFAAGPGPVMAKDKEAAFLDLTDMTGAIAGLAGNGSRVCAATFKHYNERGGVDGVKIKYIGVDTRYDVARALSAFKRYRRTPKLLLVNTVGTGLGKAIYPLIQRDKITNYTPGDGEFQHRLSRTFIYSTPYQDGFAAALDWMLEDWRKKGKSGVPIVGFMEWDNPYGREPYRGGKEYAEKIGIKLLPAELFPTGSLKHDVWLNRLARKGANYIYVGGVDPTQTNIVRDAHALGLTKTIQFVSDYWGPDRAVGVKSHKDALQGTVVVSCFSRGTDTLNHPEMTEIWKKYMKTPVKEMYGTASIGYSWAMHFIEGLRIAIKDVGYDKLNGDAMYNALQKMKGMNVTQGATGICDYSPTSRRMTRYVKFYRVKGSDLHPITDWRMAPDAVSMHKF